MDICPWTVVIPPTEECFFTDASMTQSQIGGTYGFVYKDEELKVKDIFVGYSIISDINYLECKAIYFCLCYIYWLPKNNSDIKFYIFTDSSSTYTLLNRLNTEDPVKENTWFRRQLQETKALMEVLFQSGITIHLVDIKGHTTAKRQKKYLKSKGFDFGSSYAKLITEGNKQIDRLVGEVDKNKNQYPYLQYDN